MFEKFLRNFLNKRIIGCVPSINERPFAKPKERMTGNPQTRTLIDNPGMCSGNDFSTLFLLLVATVFLRE